MRSALAAAAVVVSLATPASALVWPDVPERVERGLASADPGARRVAAQELRTLGASRGAPLVMQALGDSDVEVRLAAAESAIRLRVADATEMALAWLGERDARLRVAACDVARALPNARAVTQLARALGDADATVRAAAADALGAQTSSDAQHALESVAPLLGKLDDASPQVRIQITRSLARLGDARAVVPLVGKVQDSVSEVRQAVARALGDLGDPRASQALLLQLRDNQTEVRVEALAALGRLRAPDAVDAIAPLATERNGPVRQAAIAALGRIGTADAVKVLIGVVGQAEDAAGGLERTPVRDALVTAIASATPQLVLLLRGAVSAPAATSAAWVLGEAHVTLHAPDIVLAMRRGALPTAAALHALAGAGTSDAIPVVLEFVDDPSPVVRAEALGAAAALLDPSHPDGRAVEPLSAALRDARLSASERAKLAALLGRTGAVRAAPVLAGLVAVRDPALRVAALDALGWLGPAGADETLLDAVTDADPAVRLHAAVALADAGGARARDQLLEKLDTGDEMDRRVVLTALGGVLARLPTDAAIRRVERSLDVAAGADRDALIVTLGRAASPSGSRGLAAVAHHEDAADRRTLATVLAAHAGRADAVALLQVLLADGDPTVRAQAAWSLGTVGDASTLPALASLVRATPSDVAIDATAAVGRIAARTHAPAPAAAILCPVLADSRAPVRANALAGLALAGARCGDGAVERRLLTDDSDVVRAAAALTLARAPSPDDTRALERCASTDRAGAVAKRCRTKRAERSDATHAVEVYIMGEGAAPPRGEAPYAMELADGLVRAGTADRRGAVFDPAAPEGDLSLHRISARESHPGAPSDGQPRK